MIHFAPEPEPEPYCSMLLRCHVDCLNINTCDTMNRFTDTFSMARPAIAIDIDNNRHPGMHWLYIMENEGYNWSHCYVNTQVSIRYSQHIYFIHKHSLTHRNVHYLKTYFLFLQVCNKIYSWDNWKQF